MKRALLIVGSLLAGVANASIMYFLHWETSDYMLANVNNASEIKTIALYATDGTTTRLVQEVTIDEFKYPSTWASGWFDTQITEFVSEDGSSNYSFYVNLLGEQKSDMESPELLYDGFANNKKTFDELERFISSEKKPFSDGYWTAIMPIPEPCGGMLALLGFALLGLRRKRVAGGVAAGLMLALLMMLPMSSFAVIDVVSDNYYSMLRVQSDSINTVFAVPFVALEAATEQSPISVAEAIDIRTLSEGDMLMIYDYDSETFDEYLVSPSNTWEVAPVTTVSRSGEVRETIGATAEQMKVNPGYGSLLMRRNAASPLILHGQLPYSAKIEVKSGVNLVGSISLAPVDFNNCSIDWQNLDIKPTVWSAPKWVLGDSIVFYLENGERVQLYYVEDPGTHEKSWDHPNVHNVPTVAPRGVAFWINHFGADFDYGIDEVETNGGAK